MPAIIFRSLTLILGGVVLVAAGTEGMRYAFDYRRTHASLALWRAVQRAGTMLGVVFIMAELGTRSGPISWQTPLAFVTFVLVLASIVAISRE